MITNIVLAIRACVLLIAALSFGVNVFARDVFAHLSSTVAQTSKIQVKNAKLTKKQSKSKSKHAAPHAGADHSVSRTRASIVIDSDTGKILFSENENAHIYPASLTKMMTVYMIFDAIDKNKIKFNDTIRMSEAACAMPPSKLGCTPGQRITYRDAIDALIIRSANDVAKSIAENMSGTEHRFCKQMTRMAKRLGMRNTVFRTASGWHDVSQHSTAVDLAKIALALKRDFPHYYYMFSNTSFTFNGKIIKGHNKVVANYQGATGLKTGFTNPSGYNIAISASQNGKNLLGIVIGADSAQARDQRVVSLLDQHFGNCTSPQRQIVAKQGGRKVSKKTAGVQSRVAYLNKGTSKQKLKKSLKRAA